MMPPSSSHMSVYCARRARRSARGRWSASRCRRRTRRTRRRGTRPCGRCRRRRRDERTAWCSSMMPRTAPASPSRRTGPCARRGRGAPRTAASACSSSSDIALSALLGLRLGAGTVVRPVTSAERYARQMRVTEDADALPERPAAATSVAATTGDLRQQAICPGRRSWSRDAGPRPRAPSPPACSSTARRDRARRGRRRGRRGLAPHGRHGAVEPVGDRDASRASPRPDDRHRPVVREAPVEQASPGRSGPPRSSAPSTIADELDVAALRRGDEAVAGVVGPAGLDAVRARVAP